LLLSLVTNWAGELATAGTAFDVLAFSGSCWSFSAAWAGKQALLASAMQGSYSAVRQAGGRAAGQLLPHTTAVARSKAQQQRQQLQQRWQQQAQQQGTGRPATAPAAAERYTASSSAAAANDAAAVGEDSSSSNDKKHEQHDQHWPEQQEMMAGSRPSTAAAAGRSNDAGSGAAARPTPRNRRQQTPQMSGSNNSSSGMQQQGCVARVEPCSPVLQPTDAEHLTEAQSWVQNWPEAVGNTRLLTALITAHQYTLNSSSADGSIDSYYLFSDGLADDAAACLEWVRQQEEAGQPLRPVHTVGGWLLLLLLLLCSLQLLLCHVLQ
jgi:hypothetical protein